MKYPKELECVIDTGETLYLKDENNNHYALNYWYADKSYFREYADIEPEYVYKDEDGDTCYEYDDDRWELDTDILFDYVKDYIKKNYKIFELDEDYGDEDLVKIYEGDEWYEDMLNNLKNIECQKKK
tara:strand:- start:1949 stop:2329 length:381 start_codon:yes stop_codon:yes gene_type:complete